MPQTLCFLHRGLRHVKCLLNYYRSFTRLSEVHNREIIKKNAVTVTRNAQ